MIAKRLAQGVLGLALLTATGFSQAAVIGPSLQKSLATATADARLEIVVTYHGSRPLNDNQVAVLERIGVRGYRFDALPMAGVVATPAQIKRLAALPQVRSLWSNDAMEFENAKATAITGVQKLRTEPAFLRRNDNLPFTGRGIGVVVNDSGIDATHEDLKLGENVVQNVAGWSDLGGLSEDLGGPAIVPHTPRIENLPHTDLLLNSHGTHVSGIVGGTGEMSGGKYRGVAPGANIIGHSTGVSALLLNLLGGFDYAILRQAVYNIRVVTNSWGCSSCAGDVFDPDDPVNVATKLVADAGIVVVFSAGNSGSGANTITGNYKKAPWIVTVAAGSKTGGLTDFSSRGQPGFGVQKVTVDGEEFDLTDRPTVVAPGLNIISVRAKSADPVAWGLALTPYFDLIYPAEVEQELLPFYTAVSGTSQAAPHVAGIVALMLEANPKLGWREVKAILQQTATNLPGLDDWEGGAGFVNAHAAVASALGLRKDFGATNKLLRSFNANSVGAGGPSTDTFNFVARYDPAEGASEYQPFEVGANALLVSATADCSKVDGFVGADLMDPTGEEHYASYPLGEDIINCDYVASAPAIPGTWGVRVSGAFFGLAEGGRAADVPLTVNVLNPPAGGFTGLGDIAGHPRQAQIEAAVSKRLVDSRATGRFEPNAVLTRIELAEYLSLSAVRQNLKLNRTTRFTDLTATQSAYAEAVAGNGAALTAVAFDSTAPITRGAATTFLPAESVRRMQLAVALVRVIGRDAQALAFSGPVTAAHQGGRVPVTDIGHLAPSLLGYVQIAIDFGLIEPEFVDVAEPTPHVEARFKPGATVSRGEFASTALKAAEAYAVHVDTSIVLPDLTP